MGDTPAPKDNSYSYSASINAPGEMNMRTEGTTAAIGDDVVGILSYVRLLVTGSGRASKTGRPLGNKYFSTTPAFCTDVDTKKQVSRSIYVNNVPDGTIDMPFSTQGMNLGPGFTGLMPGVIANITRLNPLKIIGSITRGTDKECKQITMEVIGPDNVSDTEPAYVTLSDIQNMPPGWFNVSGFPKPAITRSAPEAFENRCGNKGPMPTASMPMPTMLKGQPKLDHMPNDLFIKVYYTSLGLLGLYILLKMILNKRVK
jgi:hypothetical protein